MRPTILLLSAFWLVSVNTFILLAQNNLNQCYRAQHSSDKTLQVRFNIPRRQKYNCKVRLQISVKDEQNDEIKEVIHDDFHECHKMYSNEPYVVKHTSIHTEYLAYYDICVHVLQNDNQESYLELFIGEKLNPVIYSLADNPLPLVEAQELIDLDLAVQAIRRSLARNRAFAEKTANQGYQLDQKIDQIMTLNTTATIIQIVALILFGIGWILLVQKLKNR